MILKALLSHVKELNPKKMSLAGVVVSVPYDFDDAAKKRQQSRPVIWLDLQTVLSAL